MRIPHACTAHRSPCPTCLDPYLEAAGDILDTRGDLKRMEGLALAVVAAGRLWLNADGVCDEGAALEGAISDLAAMVDPDIPD